jgi:hypothetical protein
VPTHSLFEGPGRTIKRVAALGSALQVCRRTEKLPDKVQVSARKPAPLSPGDWTVNESLNVDSVCATGDELLLIEPVLGALEMSRWP